MSASTAMATSPLQQMAATTATDYWNDSCSVEELTYSVARGATGATSNPTIVGEVLEKEMHLWRDRHPRADRRESALDRGRGHLEAERGDGRPRCRDPASGLRARGRQEGSALDPDEPEALPRCARASPSRRCISAALAPEHAGEGSGDPGRRRGGRGRDRRRRVRSTRPSASRFRRRSPSQRRSSVASGAGRRRARTCADVAGRDDDGRSAGRLDRRSSSSATGS